MAIKIAKYTFTSTTDTFPTYIDVKYNYTDVNYNNGTTTRTLIAESLPTSIQFNNITSLLSVDYLNVENMNIMKNMFLGCSSLISINTDNWNTSNVTSMSRMFNGCNSLTLLDLSGFDTRNVTNMSMMFDGCSNLRTIYMGNNINSLNDIIEQLPIKTPNNLGTIIVPKEILNSVDTTIANSKYWNIIKTPEYTFTLDTLKYLLVNIKDKFVAKEELNNKVDKVEGKQLSTNNFTDEDMNNIYNSFNDAEVNQNGTIISFYSTSENGIKTKVKDINLDI